jgi:hypothetical protein
MLILFMMPLAASRVAGATCNDDCKNEYVSSLGECRSNYEKGEEDLEDLENCLADTKGEYDDCIDDCDSMGAGGVVACTSGPKAITLASMSAPSSAAPAAPAVSAAGSWPSAMIKHDRGTLRRL